MSKINVVLNNRTIQFEYFQAQGYPTDMALPSFTSSSNILYGTLSEMVHNPDIQSIIYSNEMSDDWKKAYKYLGDRFQIKLIEYDEAKASTGEKEFPL
jgi:hypothetical protein